MGIGQFLVSKNPFQKNIAQGAATTVRCIALKDEEIMGGHYYLDCNEGNNSVRNDLKPKQINSDKKEEIKDDKTEKKEEENKNNDVAEDECIGSKLWEWSEILIESKGFKLDMVGFEEEEKERLEKEENERLEKEQNEELDKEEDEKVMDEKKQN